MKYSSFDSQVRKSNRICGGGCQAQRAGRYEKSIFSAAVVGGIVVELWKVNVVAAKLPTSRWTAVEDCGIKSPTPAFFLTRE